MYKFGSHKRYIYIGYIINWYRKIKFYHTYFYDWCKNLYFVLIIVITEVEFKLLKSIWKNCKVLYQFLL